MNPQQNTQPELIEVDFGPKPKRFSPPTIEVITAYARTKDLPDHEALKFYHYYESVGWRIGKKTMTSWHHALAGWKLRWMEKQPTQKPMTLREVSRADTMRKIRGVLNKAGLIPPDENNHQMQIL